MFFSLKIIDFLSLKPFFEYKIKTDFMFCLMKVLFY